MRTGSTSNWRPTPLAGVVGRFDVVVSDIALPGQDGFDLVRQLREQEQQRGADPTPAIALSALADLARRAEAQAAGFQEYIVKPAGAAQLLAVIARRLPRQSGDAPSGAT